MIKLTDEEMRRFICDGVLLLDSIDDAAFHQIIRDKLEYVNQVDSDVQNNILPRVSELRQVIDAPRIKGALASILGDDFMMHPLRLLVPSEPLGAGQRDLKLRGDENGPPVGEGSRSFTYWHKDSYSPLGRTRYHVPRFVYLFYFPQDTPIERGPTRVIPGTQYQDHVTEADFPFAFVPEGIQAGRCMLTAFDIEHAGMSNFTDLTRYMVKLSFFRTSNPKAPSWRCGDGGWRDPVHRLGRHSHPETWSYIWDWLRGITSSRPVTNVTAGEIDRHIGHLNGTDQPRRLAAIYSLGAMGAPARDALLASLLKAEGEHLIEPPYVPTPDGGVEPRGDQLERRWREGGYIFQDEAFALGCLGDLAIDPLIKLLDSDDPWIVINAAFSLGEIGHVAARAVPRLAAHLANSDHRVVRAILEAIASIGANTIAALPEIERLLNTPHDHWAQDLKLECLVGDQIHFNAVYALLLSDLDIGNMEGLLIDLLERPAANACISFTALEILVRRGSPEGIRHALKYLQVHCWDDSRWPEEIGHAAVRYGENSAGSRRQPEEILT